MLSNEPHLADAWIDYERLGHTRSIAHPKGVARFVEKNILGVLNPPKPKALGGVLGVALGVHVQS